MKIILASKSPRRKEILSNGGYVFECIPSDKDEIIDNSKTIGEKIEHIAYHKALDIYESHKDDLIIGADTVVVINNEILGKPKDETDAYRMIKLLEGKTHSVITGVAVLYKDNKIIFYDESYVTFKSMTIDEMNNYIKIKDIYDKAGAYAIQGDAGKYISKLEGSYYNVMGLPIEKLKKVLDDII